MRGQLRVELFNSEYYIHAEPNIGGRPVTLENRVRLINFHEDDIPYMSVSEIKHRLLALQEVSDAPHLCYASSLGRPEVAAFQHRYNEETLNGGANDWITVLNRVLKTREATGPSLPPFQI